jgi:hypothetical protein
MGFPCTATVPTWFTDSPTTCPIPCWYPALKPTTGAVAAACAIGSKTGVGAAIVAWNAAGTLGYVVTGSQAVTFNTAVNGWWAPWVLANPLPNYEGAFAISRNNGETWNQLGLINTTIDWFNDVAPAPDCSTVYLASSNNDTVITCTGFDSVWRASSNPAVTSPLPPLPIGTYWERVFTHVTAVDCQHLQSNLPILRLPPYCDDMPDGQIIAWAAQASAFSPLAQAQAWSPDFGDYWAMITTRWPIQDFAFESSTVMYNLRCRLGAWGRRNSQRRQCPCGL